MKLLIIIPILILTGCAANNIGTITPPYPQGIEMRKGALIDPDNFIDENGWAQTLVKREGNYFLWLEKLHKRIGTKAYFKVVFELKLPGLKPGQQYSLGSCRHLNEENGQADIFSIVVYEKTAEWHNKIVRAWKADTEKKKIYEIPTDDITCYNETWGL